MSQMNVKKATGRLANGASFKRVGAPSPGDLVSVGRGGCYATMVEAIRELRHGESLYVAPFSDARDGSAVEGARLANRMRRVVNHYKLDAKVRTGNCGGVYFIAA